MKIRALEPEEAEAVLELWRAAGAAPSVTDTIDAVRRMARQPSASFLVAESDERLVGSVIATFDGWRGHVYRLAVHPQFRRQGVARELVMHARMAFSSWGVRRVTALVERDRSSAMSFWEAVGYSYQPGIARFVMDLGSPSESGGMDPPDR